jgi:Uma2 family endonuclease
MLYELESDERYEIWNGEKIMMTPSSMDHESVLSNLMLIVGNYVRENRLGKVFPSNAAIYLHGDVMRKDFRLADLSYVASHRLDMIQSKGIYGAPDLIIEIVSSGKKNTDRDRVEKFGLYEQYGVSEYWIVTPFEEKIEIFTLEDEVYRVSDRSKVLSNIELLDTEVFD